MRQVRGLGVLCVMSAAWVATGGAGSAVAQSTTPSPDEPAARSGLLAAITRSVVQAAPRGHRLAALAAAREGRPCTISDEIEEMIAQDRPWLPSSRDGVAAEFVPVMACWHPDTPPSAEEQAAFEQRLFGQLLQYNVGGRWSSTATNGGAVGSEGEPITLTWSFVPDGLSITSNGVGEGTQASTLFAQMDTKFGNNRALWIQRFTESFNRWGALTGVNYVRVRQGANEWDDGATWGSAGNNNANSTRGDVRICMKDFGSAGGVLAYNSFPNDGDMVLDSRESWGSSTNNHRFLRNTIMHEHGHGLGFAHVCPTNGTKLMEPTLNTSFDGPQQDDIRAGHRNYGDINEPDNTFSTARLLGALNPAQTLTAGTVPSPAIGNAATLSIDRDGEQDWHRVTLNQASLVTATVTPIGSTYDDQPQSGGCPSGNPVNALAVANLRLQIVASNGVSVIATADNNAAGLNEVISSTLQPAGDIFVRVTETGTPTSGESQLYRLTVQSGLALTLSATDATVVGRVDLLWSAVPNATYRLFRGTTNVRANATQIASGLTSNSFSDMTATPGEVYFYWVSASQVAGFEYDFAGPETGAAAQPSNVPPVARAGPDIFSPDADGSGDDTVTLDGSASTDSDGTIVNYRWSEGLQVLANGPSPTAQVTFEGGQHTITLAVTDNNGALHSDTVIVTVNQRPTADAGLDQDLEDTDNSGSEIVTLDGTGSTDPDGTITTYIWTEGATVLSSGPSPTAQVSLGLGVHEITLRVNDNGGSTRTDTVTISVSSPPPPSCLADFNGDGTLDPDDLSDYIGCFFSSPPCPQADINGDGNADPDDLSDFIGLYFQGC